MMNCCKFLGDGKTPLKKTNRKTEDLKPLIKDEDVAAAKD